MDNKIADLNKPWWKHGFVWMIIAGPAIVVVASFITYYLAASRPNEILSEDVRQPSAEAGFTVEARKLESSQAPAVLGRNHAATGIVPPPK